MITMEVSNELLFFFSALGAFNGFLLGLYFAIIKKPKHISNIFLGTMLIFMSIRIGKSVLFYFNENLAYGYLQFGLTACLFIGPFLYFYFRSLYSTHQKNIHYWQKHLAILVPLMLVVNVVFPFEQNIDLWRPYFIDIIYLVWFGYMILCLPYIYHFLNPLIRNEISLTSQTLWDISLFIGNFVIWAAFFFCGFTSYILGALLFSFMFYLMAFQLISWKKQRIKNDPTQEKYKNKKIDKNQAQFIIIKLEVLMKEDRQYINPNLKLIDLASDLNILPHTLSQLLNDNLGKSFSTFVNEYRIDHAKKILQNNVNLTLEAIGYDCGFNSKSTFFSTFKKMTGQTPSVYQKQTRTSS